MPFSGANALSFPLSTAKVTGGYFCEMRGEMVHLFARYAPCIGEIAIREEKIPKIMNFS